MASKISLENRIWLRQLRLYGHFGTTFFTFSIRFQAYLTSFAFFLAFFVCFFSHIAFPFYGPNELEAACLSLCSMRGWPEAPINFIGHWVTETWSGESTARCSHRCSAVMAPWDHSGLAGTVAAATRSVIILPPASVLLEYEALSALHRPSFCAKILSTSKRFLRVTKSPLLSRIFQCPCLSL